MNGLGFIWVGKLKEPFFRDACAHYWKKLSRFHALEEAVIKDAPGKLPSEDKRARESEAISARIKPTDLVIVLDERGKTLSSRQLAAHLGRWVETPNRTPRFIIGGPFGMSEALRDSADFLLRLSHMTLPHELARLMLLEQLYRAASIRKGLPYHHD